MSPLPRLLRATASSGAERGCARDEEPTFAARARAHAAPRIRVARSSGTALRGLLLLLAAFGLASAGVGSDGVDEYQLKAAFLGKFVKYVTWPAERNPDVALVVAVFGQDPFGAKLDAAFKTRKSDERPVIVRRLEDLHDLQDLDELGGVHLVFVPAREASRLREILSATRGTGVLLVGESTDFAARGGVINFYLEGEKLRFEINAESARRQKLKVSSDLLKLARIVTDKG